MKQYLDIVQHVLEKGRWKENRTGTEALTCANMVFSHDMSDGFPLLTTRKIRLKSVAVELEGFLKGVCSKKWYQDRNCSYWTEWANPEVVESKTLERWSKMVNQDDLIPPPDTLYKQVQKEEDDLGAFYPHQIRRFNEAYDENCNGQLKGIDQLQNIVSQLKINPNDRRMICVNYNPAQVHKAALPACHVLWVLTHINGVLNLSWTQRSCDLMLGVPSNISSYALLLLLLCRESGLYPGNLTGMLCDVHIYENHINQAKEQLTRKPYPSPKVKIPKVLTNEKGNEQPFDIFEWTHDGYCLFNYQSHPVIKMDVAV